MRKEGERSEKEAKQTWHERESESSLKRQKSKLGSLILARDSEEAS